MIPSSCTFCGARHSMGMLFGSPMNRICTVCRNSVLTKLRALRVPLIESNPFIAELCVESHSLPDAWWYFYDSINGVRGEVSRTTRRR